MSSPLRLKMSSRGASEVQSTSAPSFPVAGAAFPAAAAGLGQGLTREQMQSCLITLGWPPSQIQDYDDDVLAQVVNMVLSQAESSAEEPLPHTANTTQSGLDVEAWLAKELAGLSAEDFNQNWYLDPSYWRGEVLPEAMPIPAMPFPENYPDKNNHLDLLKAHLLVWNVMHGHAVNAHAEGEWAYAFNDESGQVISGETLRGQYNDLNLEIKQLLDKSCQVLFPCELRVDGNHKLSSGHIEYGAHMGFGVFVLAKLLRTGQVRSFLALWYLAREFRLCAPGFTPRYDRGLPGTDLFSVSRDIQGRAGTVLPVARTEGYPLLTPLRGQYESFLPKFEVGNRHPLNVQCKVHSETANKVHNIQLTQYKYHLFSDYVEIKAIDHAPPRSILAVLGVLEFYYARLGYGQENAGVDAVSSSANPKQDLFSLFWWSAHGCLDGAGSAAKSDECLRALYLALYNQPLPAWEPGFVPDLEAMLCKDTGAFESKINAEAFADGANWEVPLTRLPRVFPKPTHSLLR